MQCNVDFGYELSVCSSTGRRDFPDAYWLLANSPTFKYTNPNGSLT